MSQAAPLPFQTELCGLFLPLLEAIADGVAPAEVYGRALALPQGAINADAAVLRVYAEDHDCYHLAAQQGLSQPVADELRCVPAGLGPWAEAANTGQPALLDDSGETPWARGALWLPQGFRGLMVIPLMLGPTVIGTLDLLSRASDHWERDRLQSVFGLSQGLVCLLHQARLTDRSRAKAVQVERAQLAQEIHDCSLQLLASLALWSEEAQSALEEGDLEEAREALTRVIEAARGLSAEFRDEVGELREPSDGEDLLAYLREYLEQFSCQWGVDARLEVACEEPLRLSPETQGQLVRIVQETLANVRQHARASQVTVTVERENGCVRLSIQDNGQGFDPREVPSGRFGLRIMRERARTIRGDVCVSSQPGEGTLVEISVPLEESVECSAC